MKKVFSHVLTLIFLFALYHQAVKAQDSADASKHLMFNDADLKWGDGPPSLPPGAKMTVLQGDPSKEGEFTIRAKFPANYKVPAHWHPTTENVTVLKGKFYMGHGDKLDENSAMMLNPGGFASMTAMTHHFAFTKEECIIQIHAMGPFAITYINPADDPRKQ
jgi:hypothetical protein